MEFTEVPPLIEPILKVVFGLVGDGRSAELLNRSRQSDDRIRRAKVAPRMSARAGHRDQIAAAAQRLVDDAVRPGAVDYQRVSDLVAPRRFGEKMSHAANIALAFLAYVGNKDQRRFGPQLRSLQRGNQRQHRRETGSIVGNAGPVKLVAFAASIDLRRRGEHCVHVRGDGDVFRIFANSGPHANHVAQRIDVNIFQPEKHEMLAQPLTATAFSKRGSGDIGHFQLPIGELPLIGTEPRKRAVNLRIGRKFDDFFTNGSSRIQIGGGRRFG